MKNQVRIVVLVYVFIVSMLQAMDKDTEVTLGLKDKPEQGSVVKEEKKIEEEEEKLKTEEDELKKESLVSKSVIAPVAQTLPSKLKILSVEEEEKLKTEEDEPKRELAAPKPMVAPALPIVPLGLEATLAEIIADRKEEKSLLTSLSTDQQNAGVEDSKCYAASLKLDERISFKTLHDEGNSTMTVKELQEVFFKSMFQYYTNEFLSYDMSAKSRYRIMLGCTPEDYDRFIKLVTTFGLDLKNFTPKSNPDAKPWIVHNKPVYFELLDTVHGAIESFKKNESFAKLAGAYQRWKVVLEKVESTNLNSTEQFSGDFVYTVDRIPTDLQVMIYYWMQEGYESFKQKFKAALPGEKITSGDFLATFVPSFITRPYYATIMSKLDELCKPVEKLQEISL